MIRSASGEGEEVRVGVRLKRCTPAAAAEIGRDYRAQINDSRDALTPLSQQQWRDRPVSTLNTFYFHTHEYVHIRAPSHL